MNRPESSNLIRGILATVAASGSPLRGRLRLQKMAYFLHLAGIADFLSTRFSYEPYGPSSRQLSAVLQDLLAAGLVRERRDGDDPAITYAYELTDDGQEWLKQQSSTDGEKIANVVSKLREESPEAIELAAAAAFFRKKEGVDPDTAVKRAVKLNPQDERHVGAARAILAQIAL